MGVGGGWVEGTGVEKVDFVFSVPVVTGHSPSKLSGFVESYNLVSPTSI